MLLEYSRTRPDAVPPTRGHPSDAGLDVYYCPENTQEVGRNLKPGDSVILPTGLRFGVPHGYMLEVKNRSSLASKRSLIVGACVVDSGYDGEIFINIHNIGNEDQFVAKGTKIAQLVMIPDIFPDKNEFDTPCAPIDHILACKHNDEKNLLKKNIIATNSNIHEELMACILNKNIE